MSETTGHFVDTVRVLVARDLRMRYKGSFLGILWAVLTPLATVFVFEFLFTKVLNLGGSHFPVFLYTGLLPWTWFQASLQSGSSSLADNRDLVRTPFFSKVLLPWTATCTNFIFYLFSLPVLFALMAYDGLPLTRALLLLPAVWLVQWVLTIGLTILMAAIGILIRDWQHLLIVLLMFGFYLTPIFYDVKQLPPETARWFAYNPMAAVVSAHRSLVIDARPPDWFSLGLVTAAGVGILAMSLFIFRGLEDSFIDKT